MGMDIRLPIGLMFSVFGILLIAFGALGDKSIYERSLGINVNLGWGVVLLLFGAVMLVIGRPRSGAGSKENGPDGPERQAEKGIKTRSHA
jgi:hypothetical protein